MNAQVTLWFSGAVNPELIQFSFRHPIHRNERFSYRGKTGGAHNEQGSFQWTPAVQALALFFLKCIARSDASETALSGGYGSPATSLDFAINKQPVWLQDMFGVAVDGTCLIHRLVLRTNPGSKRSGPVELNLNVRQLSPEGITVYLGDERVTDSKRLEPVIVSIEALFSRFVSRRAKPRSRADAHGVDSLSAFPPLTREAVDRVFHRNFKEELCFRIDKHAAKNGLSNELFGFAERNRFLTALDNEMLGGYRDTSVFSADSLGSALSRLNTTPAMRKCIGALPSDLCDFLSSPRGPASLGVGADEDKILSILNDGPPLEFAVNSTDVSTLCMLYFLKYVRGVNISVESGLSAHGQELLTTVLEGIVKPAPSAVVMGITQTLALLRSSRNPGFRCFMAMPKMPHRVVGSRKDPNFNPASGRFLIYEDSPGYFNQAASEGRFSPNLSRIETGSHDSIVNALWQDDPDARALIWFPHYTLYDVFKTHRVTQVLRAAQRHGQGAWESDSDFLSSTVCLALHQSVYEKGRAQMLGIALRDAWLSLVENPTVRRFLLRVVVEDVNLAQVLFRGAGLQRYVGRRGNTSQSEVVEHSKRYAAICSSGFK